MRRALRGARCLRGRSGSLTVGRGVPGVSVARRSALLGSARHLARLGNVAAMDHLLELVGALGEEDDGT